MTVALNLLITRNQARAKMVAAFLIARHLICLPRHISSNRLLLHHRRRGILFCLTPPRFQTSQPVNIIRRTGEKPTCNAAFS
jgi:hypothetical protein